MTAWEAFVLGILQGATEFLPISSSGHLVMAQTVLDVEVPGVLFEVWVHMATLLSILLIYHKRIIELAKGVLGHGLSTAEVRVHPSGKFLYGSNRGHHTIVVYTIDPATGKPLMGCDGRRWRVRSVE